MVILVDYHVVPSASGLSKQVVIDTPPVCPDCFEAQLEHYDDVRRLCREEDGKEVWYMIPRGVCPVCSRNRQPRFHRMLPPFLYPSKQYLEKIITAVIQNDSYAEDIAVMNRPSDMTLKRWKKWFEDNREKLEDDPFYERLFKKL